MALPMPEREVLEERLLKNLNAARIRFDSGECSAEDYMVALEQFANFVLYDQQPAPALTHPPDEE